MKTIFISGICGFIGSNFAQFIAKNYSDHLIIGIDNLSAYSNRENIADLEAQGKVIFYQVDITNRPDMQKIYERYSPDYVVNFAAESHNDRAIINPTSFMFSNILGAHNLLELSRIIGVERHIQISTIEVYGEQADSIPYFTEGSPLNAKTPYSASKAAGDLIVRSYIHTYPDMDICLTHCANNYGPYQFPEKLIPLAITNILQGRKVALYGDGLQKRDWLHALDHCRGIDLVLRMKNKPIISSKAAFSSELLPIFDFSARQEFTNIQIIRMILDELNLAFDKWVEFVTDRPNHDRRYLINPAKVEKELGFQPQIPIETGIRETVRWYVDNTEWWQKILTNSRNLQITWDNINIH